MSSNAPRSEDELGRKWDGCIADTFIKMGSGLGVGIIFSVFLFKRKTWPVVFGMGTGLGMGYSNCQHEFNSPFTNKVLKIMAKEKSTEVAKSDQNTSNEEKTAE